MKRKKLDSIQDRVRKYISKHSKVDPNYIYTVDNFAHYGKYRTVTKVLTRMCHEGSLVRIYQGYYLKPGSVDVDEVVRKFSYLRRERVTRGYGACFNTFGIRKRGLNKNDYLTKGSSKSLVINGRIVNLVKSADWELLEPSNTIGEAYRVLIHPLSTSEEKKRMINHINSGATTVINRMKNKFPSWVRPYFESHPL